MSISHPRIVELAEIRLVGMQQRMSYANYTIGELWRSFMPRRREITGQQSTDLISMAIYPADYFANFNPAQAFTRWAAVEVADAEPIPAGMESFLLAGGLYAVFDYKGLAGDPAVFQHIFGSWLPASDYELDERHIF